MKMSKNYKNNEIIQRYFSLLALDR